MKKEINLESKWELESEEIGEGVFEYKVLLNGVEIDSFELDHKNEDVECDLLETCVSLFNIDESNYDSYIKAFKINPPLLLTKAEAIEKLNAIIDELNGDWAPNWNVKNERKCYIAFDHKTNKYGCDTYYTWQHIYSLNSIKLEEIATKIINEHKDLLDIVFDIK